MFRKKSYMQRCKSATSILVSLDINIKVILQITYNYKVKFFILL